jgi:hypothetical protein
MICLIDCLFLTLTFCKWCAVAETETETDYSETETEADAESDISEPEIQQNSAYSKNWTPLARHPSATNSSTEQSTKAAHQPAVPAAASMANE